MSSQPQPCDGAGDDAWDEYATAVEVEGLDRLAATRNAIDAVLEGRWLADPDILLTMVETFALAAADLQLAWRVRGRRGRREAA